MSPATNQNAPWHDTLSVMVGKGRAKRTFRMDAVEWESFGAATQPLGIDRATLLRRFARYFIAHPEERAALMEKLSGGGE